MALKELEVNVGDRVLVEIPKENMRLLVSVEPDKVCVHSDKCKHRGGPIHLCYRDADNIRRCPWHDRKVLRDDVCDDVSATYYPNTQMLRLISRFPEDVVWPAKVVTEATEMTAEGQT